MIATLKHGLITAGLVAAAMYPLAAQAQVVNGTAAKVPSFQARGATDDATVLGRLAPSLQGKPVLVRIHADWCSACKATQSTIDRLRQTYAGKINFVQFDVTNAKAAAISQERAKALGLETFYAATKTATSTVAVIDPTDGKIYSTFYNDNAVGDYESVINAALKAEKSPA
jgi:thiol-disulfide isomerase/thioredoxin